MRPKPNDLDDRRKSLFAAHNEYLPLTSIQAYPVLSGVLDWWDSAGKGAPPTTVDPSDLPPRSLAHLILIDLVGTDDAVIRLAGTLPCNLYGHELRGTSVHHFFDADDAKQVLADLHQVAKTGMPTLTKRSYISINGKFWNYARLMVPLAPDGKSVTRILKALEPETFVKAT